MSTPLRSGFFSTHLFKACMVIMRAHFSALSGQAAPQRRPKCSASSRLACSCSPHQKKALARTQTSGSALKYFSRTYTSAPLRFPFHSVNDVCPSALLRELRPHCAAMLAKTLRSLAARVQLLAAPEKGPCSHTNLRVGVEVCSAHTHLRASAVPFLAVLMQKRLS